VEFTGGRLLEYRTTRPVDLDAARRALADAGLPRAVVQASGDGNLTVRTGQLDPAGEDRVRQAVTTVGGQSEELRDEFIGPTIGAELRRKALLALGIALVMQLGYLAVRFRWTFGVAAVLAMFHDVAILPGLFAWLGKPLDGVFLAALFVLGGDTLTDFALALLVGILVGTYSSVFVATPLLVAFEQRAGGQPATALSRAWRSRPSPARSRR
jgi:SecD/SecF fusion protein